jgi:hypothetical protein
MSTAKGFKPGDPATATMAMHAEAQSRLLSSLLAEARSDTLNLAVGDFNGQEITLEKFPVSGIKRLCIRRTGFGFPSFPVTTTPVVAVPVNEGRLGGTIVNTGANAVFLYLGAQITDAVPQPEAGIPVIWLVANGGSWDFRLGNVLWAGSVTVVAAAATSTLTIAEV